MAAPHLLATFTCKRPHLHARTTRTSTRTRRACGQVGDRILSLNGMSLKQQKLAEAMGKLKPGADRLDFRVLAQTVAPAPRQQQRRARGRGGGGGGRGRGGGGGMMGGMGGMPGGMMGGMGGAGGMMGGGMPVRAASVEPRE